MRFDMSDSRAAMSRLELILAAALCSLVAVLALPRLQRARIEGNERLAARHIISLAAAQTGWKNEVMVDQDADRRGEYGLLGELAAEIIPRSGAKRAEPAFAPALFTTGGADGQDGCAVVNGYVFRIYLAQSVEESGEVIPGDDKSLGGTAKAPGRTLSDVDAIDMQEAHFAIYAWPLDYGRTGRRAFFINEKQQLSTTEMAAKVYSGRGASGSENTPACDAAFTGEAFTSEPANRMNGRDANLWIGQKN